MSNSQITTPSTFAAQVGRIALDTFNVSKIGELLIEELYGLLLLQKLNRAGLRLVLVTDADIGADEPTVELPALHAPLDVSFAVRMDHEMSFDSLELERTDRMPALLRRQAE